MKFSGPATELDTILLATNSQRPSLGRKAKGDIPKSGFSFSFPFLKQHLGTGEAFE